MTSLILCFRCETIAEQNEHCDDNWLSKNLLWFVFNGAGVGLLNFCGNFLKVIELLFVVTLLRDNYSSFGIGARGYSVTRRVPVTTMTAILFAIVD